MEVPLNNKFDKSNPIRTSALDLFYHFSFLVYKKADLPLISTKIQLETHTEISLTPFNPFS